MNAVRNVMTLFLAIIVWLTIMGWRWSVGLPSPKIEGARAVLIITAMAAASGILLIWKYDPRKVR